MPREAACPGRLWAHQGWEWGWGHVGPRGEPLTRGSSRLQKPHCPPFLCDEMRLPRTGHPLPSTPHRPWPPTKLRSTRPQAHSWDLMTMCCGTAGSAGGVSQFTAREPPSTGQHATTSDGLAPARPSHCLRGKPGEASCKAWWEGGPAHSDLPCAWHRVDPEQVPGR